MSSTSSWGFDELHPATRALIRAVLGPSLDGRELWPNDAAIWGAVRHALSPRQYAVLAHRFGGAASPALWRDIGNALGIATSTAEWHGQVAIRALREKRTLVGLASPLATADLGLASDLLRCLASSIRSATSNDFWSLVWFGGGETDQRDPDIAEAIAYARHRGRPIEAASTYLLATAERGLGRAGIGDRRAIQLKLQDAAVAAARGDTMPLDVFLRALLPVGATVDNVDRCVGSADAFPSLMADMIRDIGSTRPCDVRSLGRDTNRPDLEEKRAAALVAISRDGRGMDVVAAALRAARQTWLWLDDAAAPEVITAACLAVADYVVATIAGEHGFNATALERPWRGRGIHEPVPIPDHEDIGPLREEFRAFRQFCVVLSAPDARHVTLMARKDQEARYPLVVQFADDGRRAYGNARGLVPMFLDQSLRRAIMDAGVAVMYRDLMDASEYAKVMNPWAGVWPPVATRSVATE